MWLNKAHSSRSLENKTREYGVRTPYEQPFTWEGAFPLRENIESPLTWSRHHDIYIISVAYRGFQPCLPDWSSDCNGHILIVRPRRNEASGTRVLVCPLCLISSWNTDTSLEMLYCPGQILESKHRLSLSFLISLSFSLSLWLSISYPFTFSWILLHEF